MLYQPDLMIYVWMLPVLGFVVVPVLWAITCMLYRAVERSRLADVSGLVDFGSKTSMKLNLWKTENNFELVSKAHKRRLQDS